MKMMKSMSLSKSCLKDCSPENSQELPPVILKLTLGPDEYKESDLKDRLEALRQKRKQENSYSKPNSALYQSEPRLNSAYKPKEPKPEPIKLKPVVSKPSFKPSFKKETPAVEPPSSGNPSGMKISEMGLPKPIFDKAPSPPKKPDSPKYDIPNYERSQKEPNFFEEPKKDDNLFDDGGNWFDDGFGDEKKKSEPKEDSIPEWKREPTEQPEEPMGYPMKLQTKPTVTEKSDLENAPVKLVPEESKIPTRRSMLDALVAAKREDNPPLKKEESEDDWFADQELQREPSPPYREPSPPPRREPSPPPYREPTPSPPREPSPPIRDLSPPSPVKEKEKAPSPPPKQPSPQKPKNDDLDFDFGDEDNEF